MAQTTLTVKNGIIRLPKKLQKAWRQAEVIVFPSKDTIVVKKIQKSLGKLSDIANRISLPRMSATKIDKEVKAYRKTSR